MPKQDKEKAKMWYFDFFDAAHFARENKRETRFSVYNLLTFLAAVNTGATGII